MSFKIIIFIFLKRYYRYYYHNHRRNASIVIYMYIISYYCQALIFETIFMSFIVDRMHAYEIRSFFI